jgi:hypothetical protein
MAAKAVMVWEDKTAWLDCKNMTVLILAQK